MPATGSSGVPHMPDRRAKFSERFENDRRETSPELGETHSVRYGPEIRAAVPTRPVSIFPRKFHRHTVDLIGCALRVIRKDLGTLDLVVPRYEFRYSISNAIYGGRSAAFGTHSTGPGFGHDSSG